MNNSIKHCMQLEEMLSSWLIMNINLKEYFKAFPLSYFTLQPYGNTE